MKLYRSLFFVNLCFLFLFIFVVDGQRRHEHDSTETEKVHRQNVARGRRRFSSSEIGLEVSSTTPTLSVTRRRKLIARAKPSTTTSSTLSSLESSKRFYEVEEIIDEFPNEYKRPNKPRVLTESKFEAQNIPTNSPLLIPNLNKESSVEVTTFQETSTSETVLKLENVSETLNSKNKNSGEDTTRNDLRKRPEKNVKIADVSSTVEPNIAPRANLDLGRTSSKSLKTDVSKEVPSESAKRNRGIKRINSDFARKLPDNTETKFPEIPNRSRDSRRLNPRKNEQTTSTTSPRVESRRLRTRRPEPDISTPKPRSFRRREEDSTPSLFTAEENFPVRQRSGRKISEKTESAPEKISLDLNDNIKQNSKQRFKSRFVLPISNEQKLEVLPLFATDDKTVLPNINQNIRSNVKSSKGRSRTGVNRSVQRRDFNDDITAAATENEVKTLKPETSTSRSVRVETRTEIKKQRKPKTETIISNITEVTSKRTITRKRPDTNRGRKKAELTKILNSSEEEIDESDNYPEAFKAIIQAKKNNNKESSSSFPITKATTEKVVTTLRQIEDIENELVPKTKKTKHQPLRKTKSSEVNASFSSTTTVPTVKLTSPSKSKQIIKATTYSRPTSVPVKFHAKFESTQNSQHKTSKSFSPKPPRGLYSSRKNKENNKNTTKRPSTPQVTGKSNRFSSRYRKDSTRVIRTSTSPPVYIPTVPTVTPKTTSIKNGIISEEFGLEVISFDDPVNTLQSANLVSSEFNATSNPLVSMAQTKSTEKSVSIIERIINSITALSTTTEEPKKTTLSTQNESTKSSAILKLATKKPTKLDKTDKPKPTVTTSTSEKPTTIIEKILNSLSAIQAEDSQKSIQVGSNFNTLSSSTTTPLSVTKSTLSDKGSTSINPLKVLDEIENEQTLQKRTIGKLLNLLNDLTSSTTSSNVVIVTPKTFIPNSKPIPTSTLSSTTVFESSSITTNSATTEQNADTSLLFTSASLEPKRFTIPITTQETITPSFPATTAPPTTTPINSPETSTLPSTLPIYTTLLPTSTTSLREESPTTQQNDILQNTIPSATTTSKTTTTEKANYKGVVPLILDRFFASTTEAQSTVVNPSTVPPLIKFEVSPGSVSVFSANDLSNAITDDSSTTVIIPKSITNDDSLTTIVTPTVTTVDSTTVPITTTTDDIESSTLFTPYVTFSSDASTTPSTTTTSTNETTFNRSGRLLNFEPDPVQNSIENTTNSQNPDYFIFAILNNNTILRKRPTVPPKEAPFIIVGVYPNNTIIRKYPNGSIVPMEPIIRVSGFDTRENPPPLSEITSNQVTPDQEGQSPGTVGNGVEPNELSLSNNSNSTNSTIVPSTTITNIPNANSTTANISTATTASISTLSEILNRRTVQDFNKIINNTDVTLEENLNAATDTSTSTNDLMFTTSSTLSNRVLDDVRKSTKSSITENSEKPTTVVPLSQPVTTTGPTTTFFPTFFTTFLSTLPKRLTTFPTTTVPPTTTTAQPISLTTLETISITSTTPIPTTTPTPTTTPIPTTTSTTTPIPTQPSYPTTTTAVPRPIVLSTTKRSIFDTLEPLDISSLPTKKPLTEEQKKEIEALQQLEKEQQSILSQLAFLTNLNFGNQKKSDEKTTQPNTYSSNNLANRIISLAVERDRGRALNILPRATSTTTVKTTTTTSTTPQPPPEPTTKKPKKLTDSQQEIVEELLKQLNRKSTVASPYGNSNDALIAALLKEQGIGPTTPKGLEEIYQHTTTSTTKRPKTTTRQPGRILQGLNWLLNVIAPLPTPPPTQKPKTKTKPKPKTTKKPDVDPMELSSNKELLSNEPTNVTPIVTVAPKNKNHVLSPEDIQKLIKQLEELRENPDNGKLDLSQIKSLQNLINSEEGLNVQITRTSSSGNISPTTRKPRVLSSTSTTTARPRVVKSTTPPILSVSNSLLDDNEESISTTSRPRMSLPPVRLRPVPGIEDDESLVRGNLINAAVNVTKAISQFLGSALQASATHLSRLISSGSGNIRHYFSSSSVSQANVPS